MVMLAARAGVSVPTVPLILTLRMVLVVLTFPPLLVAFVEPGTDVFSLGPVPVAAAILGTAPGGLPEMAIMTQARRSLSMGDSASPPSSPSSRTAARAASHRNASGRQPGSAAKPAGACSSRALRGSPNGSGRTSSA